MLSLARMLSVLYLYLRPFIKWFLHRFTRLCELQRLCYGATKGSSRCKGVERSLRMSKNESVRTLVRDLDEMVEFCNDEEFAQFAPRAIAVVTRAKRIKPHIHPDFAKLFGECVEQIWGYKRLLFIAERLRQEQYDADNLEHERKLLDLWRLLMPETELQARVTKQWQDIGFQGDDPKTDFRGMGLLGLENLLYFGREYNDAARHVLLHSLHPAFGYTFAIVGINLTSMAYKLLKTDQAQTHFYNVSHTACTLDHFHKFYCYLFFEFDRLWMDCEPRNIMEFPVIHQTFEANILEALDDDKTVFKTNLVIERV